MKTGIEIFMFVALLGAVSNTGCKKDNPASPRPEPEPDPVPVVVDDPVTVEYLLPLIETTDIHGHVVENEDGTVHYRMAYIADKANDIRTVDGRVEKDRLLLLDGGDLYQGAPVSNLLDGWPVYVSMDRMGYDAVALGNHEFDWGFDNVVDPDATLPDYERGGKNWVNEVPVLCANIYLNGEGVSATDDYVIVEKTAVSSAGKTATVRIGVIGFAVNYASSIMSSRFTDAGYTIWENYSLANDIARDLESSGQCDATVLLIHGAADRAAGSLGSSSAIDLVLGGHTHTTMSGKTVSGLSYLQGGRYGEHYAYGELKFNVNETSGEVSFAGVVNQKVLPVDSYRDLHTTPSQNANNLDAEILAVSDEALEATATQMNDVIGYITVGATSYYINGSGERAAVVSNWMCDILRRIGEADVAFVNSGGIRTYFSLGGQSRRNITAADVYELFPFSNLVYVYDIPYRDLLQVFEYSLTSQGQILFSRMTGLDCRYSGSSVVSLEKDGTVIYEHGQWADGWEYRSAVLAVSEYVATTQRRDSATGLSNPLLGWNSDQRLVSNNLVDNENAVRVLREEAAASGGHLFIDTSPHFLLVQ